MNLEGYHIVPTSSLTEGACDDTLAPSVRTTAGFGQAGARDDQEEKSDTARATGSGRAQELPVSPGSPVANAPWHGKRTTVQVVSSENQVVSAGNQVVSGATQIDSKIRVSPINISTPRISTHFSGQQLSAIIPPKRQRQVSVVNILQTHQGPQHVVNTAAVRGPDAVAGVEIPHVKIPEEAVEISVQRSKDKAVAGREYRSHLLRRIDPASSSRNASSRNASVDPGQQVKERTKRLLSEGIECGGIQCGVWKQ
jgi:hypothetical protein